MPQFEHDSDETGEALQALRNAVLMWRFPILIVSSIQGFLVVLLGLSLLFSAGTAALSMSGIHRFGSLVIHPTSPLGAMFQIALSAGLFFLAAMPVQMLFRAGIAGLKARTDPSKVLAMARLHERYWLWMLGLTGVYVAFVLLLVILAGFR